MTKDNILVKVGIYSLLAIGVITILFPLYITIITALKTPAESAANFFALPSSFYLGNFKKVLQSENFPYYVSNSVLITIVSVGFIAIFVPIVSYALARNMQKHKYFKLVYIYFLLSIFTPFHVLMVPLTQLCTKLGLTNQVGLIIIYITFSLGQGVFLFVGFLKSIPVELEDAAKIDGCGIMKTFFYIIYPIAKPMTATIVILNTLWIWNDFLLPLLILNRNSIMWTLPLFQYNFQSTYTFDYNLAFASFLFSIVPMMILYIFMQKYIIEGLTAGAVK